MSDEDTLELRRVIVAHLAAKMLAEVERPDDKRSYTAEDYERLLASLNRNSPFHRLYELSINEVLNQATPVAFALPFHPAS